MALLALFEGAYLLQTKLVEEKTNFFASVLPGVLVDLTNADRQQSGVGTLTLDPALSQAAQLKADDMAAKGYFAHVSPEGKTPWYWLDAVGYKYTYAGENLAVDFNDSKDVEDAWMASPTHHANIVKAQYTRVGFAVAKGMYQGKETTFVVQEFATPPGTSAPAKVAVAPTSAASLATAVSDVVKKVVPKVAAPTPTPEVASVTPSSGPTAVASVAAPAATQVLGTETAKPDSAPTIMAESGFVAKAAASPNHTSTYVLGALAALFFALLMVAIFVHMRVQYIEVIGGGFLVVAVSLALLVFNTTSAPTVKVPSGAQSASVVQAL